MRKFLALFSAAFGAVLVCAVANPAFAQCNGEIPAGYFCGNATSAGNLAAGVAPTAMFNRAFGTVNNGVLATNASAVPAFTTTLPAVVQGNITGVGTVTSGSIGASLLTGTLPNAVQDNITRLGTVTSGAFNGSVGSTTPNTVAATTGLFSSSVGIVSTSPESILDVTGATQGTITTLGSEVPGIILQQRLNAVGGGNNQGPELEFRTSNGVDIWTAAAIAAGALDTDTAYGGYLGFFTSPGGATNPPGRSTKGASLIERLRIASNGNIGIGTTANPTAQLHTTGTVRLAGIPGASTAGCLSNDTSGNISAGTVCNLSSVNQYYATSCDNTGATDATTCIQGFVTTAASTGGTVLLPSGVFKIDCNAGATGVTFANGSVTLQGAGYLEYQGYQGQTSSPLLSNRGTRILTTNTSCSPFIVSSSATNTQILDILITQTQPSDTGGWTPTTYPPSIVHSGSAPNNSSAGRLTIRRIMCWGVYWCIKLGDGTPPLFSARAIVRDVEICAFNTGISVEAASDVTTLENIHQWQFCYDGSQPNILAYVRSNVVGIISARNDDPNFSNIFIHGTKYCMRFVAGSGGNTVRAKINNVECDGVARGISAEASNISLFITNFGHQPGSAGGSPVTGGAEVSLDMTSGCVSCTIVITNSILTNLSENVIQVTNGILTLSNTTINTWNRANNSSVAVYVPGATAVVGLVGSFSALNGNGVSYKGGAGTVKDANVTMLP